MSQAATRNAGRYRIHRIDQVDQEGVDIEFRVSLILQANAVGWSVSVDRQMSHTVAIRPIGEAVAAKEGLERVPKGDEHRPSIVQPILMRLVRLADSDDAWMRLDGQASDIAEVLHLASRDALRLLSPDSLEWLVEVARVDPLD